jgi:hypothetical protein
MVIADKDDDVDDEIIVQIVRENLSRPKPYLGGFKAKNAGTVFHHASSQTDRKLRTQVHYSKSIYPLLYYG